VFLEHLVRFIIADNQVSLNNFILFHSLTDWQSIRVVECPEFRRLCMVLRPNIKIPCRDKIREAILTRWRQSFESLRDDFSVSLPCFVYRLALTLTNSNLADELVSLQIFGQMQTWHHFWR
jgi:hypothetical protein